MSTQKSKQTIMVEFRDLISQSDILLNIVESFLYFLKKDGLIQEKNERIVRLFFLDGSPIDEIASEFNYATNEPILAFIERFMVSLKCRFIPSKVENFLILKSAFETKTKELDVFKKAHLVAMRLKLDDPDIMDFLIKPIAICGFSTRLENVLRGLRITSVCDIFDYKRTEIRDTRNCGKTLLKELEDFIFKYANLTLN